MKGSGNQGVLFSTAAGKSQNYNNSNYGNSLVQDDADL